MLKHFKHYALALILAFTGAIGVAALQPTSVVAQASAQQAACEAVGGTFNAGTGECADPPGESSVNDVLATVLNFLSLIAGIIAVIMIIIAGLRFITGQGEPSSVAQARNAIIYAAVGIVIVVLSQVLVQFVIGEATTQQPSPATAPPVDPDTPPRTPI